MRPFGFIGAVLVAVAVGLVPANPALAHDGPVTLDVASDGAGGVTVLAIFERDKHPVEDAMRLVLTATGEGGRTVGPIQLLPRAEGRGFFASGDVLTPGSWEVTVSAAEPYPAKVTVKVDARPAQTPPPAPSGDPRASDEQRRGWSGWLWWLGGAAVLFAAWATIVTLRRRRTRPPAAPH